MKISYACASNIGLRREKNQDNFICRGLFMHSDAADGGAFLSGCCNPSENTVFGVFDGMGGEQQGEAASYIAASKAAQYPFSQGGDSVLADFCLEANRAIADYTAANWLRFCGSTAAMLMFTGKSIRLCSLGDSRIYRIRGGRTAQLTRDHVAPGYGGRKAPLTQCLGIPETEMQLIPCEALLEYTPGDRYLICSDGLTDMLTDAEIGSAAASGAVEDAAKQLLRGALRSGGWDNITLILLEIA